MIKMMVEVIGEEGLFVTEYRH